MCIDFRGLNENTVKNCKLLPRIDDLFDQVQGAKVFCSIDLQSAYSQVRLKPDDVLKTAFTQPRVHDIVLWFDQCPKYVSGCRD